MEDYILRNSAPWAKLPVKSIIVQEGVTTIGTGAFVDLKELTDVTLPSTLLVINGNSFAFCTSLKELKIPEGVYDIGAKICRGCSSLATVYLPSTLRYIYGRPFYECPNLKNVYYGGSEDLWNEFISCMNSEKVQFDYLGKHYICGNNVERNGLLGVTVHFVDPITPTPTPTPTPTDEPSAWAKAEISSAISIGLVPENLQKNYTKPISRGEVARMFVNLLEKSTGKNIDTILAENGVSLNDNAFSDTTDQAVLAANALGIIKGTGGGKFSPNGTLTRAQIAAIMNREATLLGIDTNGYQNPSTDTKGHWVDSELGWPVYAGIINGVGNNRFDPDNNLTTEQAIAITYRALGVLG